VRRQSDDAFVTRELLTQPCDFALALSPGRRHSCEENQHDRSGHREVYEHACLVNAESITEHAMHMR